MDVLAAVRATILANNLIPKDSHVVVAVSGGPDSLCLAHTLLQLRDKLSLKLHIAHLNHHLRPEAAADAEFVAGIASEWGLPHTIGSADVRALARAEHRSLEEAARVARYRFLLQVACRVQAEVVAVGHNADDQVETVLMHCLRGSGLAGLRGMQRRAPWPEAAAGGCLAPVLVRPLLGVPRSDIDEYCREHHLEPRIDRTNVELTYFRNRIRHDLLPHLETYNPQIRRVLRHTAELLADDYQYLQEAAEAHWPQLVLSQTSEAIVLRREAFRALARALQRGVLRRAGYALRPTLRNLGWAHIERAREAAVHAPTGATATLTGDLVLEVRYEHLILRSAGRVLVEPWIPQMAQEQMALPSTGRLQLAPGGWSIDIHMSSEPLPAQEERRERQLCLCLDAEQAGRHLELRTRRPGDRFRARGLGGHSKSVKDYMIEAKIPQPARARVPLLVSEHGVLWVVGWRPSEVAAPGPHTRRYLCLRLIAPEGSESIAWEGQL